MKGLPKSGQIKVNQGKSDQKLIGAEDEDEEDDSAQSATQCL